MEELIPTNSIFGNLGTNNLPVNCGWINGKHNTRGKKHIHKIGEFYYESFYLRKGKSIGLSDVGVGRSRKEFVTFTNKNDYIW